MASEDAKTLWKIYHARTTITGFRRRPYWIRPKRAEKWSTSQYNAFKISAKPRQRMQNDKQLWMRRCRLGWCTGTNCVKLFSWLSEYSLIVNSKETLDDSMNLTEAYGQENLVPALQ
ncbi:unnamed protein product [Cylicocyclus nassatus]|uniref:Uncharacterized protein n=1 Tax=Cylicocyclus nassatus TaxID=53992 RepID=A0AA36MAE2_CYLNA|nr:unnamed protein product [Cylicocyclus nassatus]